MVLAFRFDGFITKVAEFAAQDEETGWGWGGGLPLVWLRPGGSSPAAGAGAAVLRWRPGCQAPKRA